VAERPPVLADLGQPPPDHVERPGLTRAVADAPVQVERELALL
jgi:hypothetical protein